MQQGARGRGTGRNAAERVTVLLVEDHEVVREGLRLLIERSDPSLAVVAEAGTAGAAREVLRRRPIDVAVLDVVLPDGDGLQLCREIRSSHPDVACLILTASRDAHQLVAARLAGASGYLSKEASQAQVVAAIGAAHRGESMLDDATMARALQAMTTGYEGHALVGSLTDQERQVFALVGQGLSNQEIAEQLHLAEKTIKNYMSRILSKLGMSRRTEAAILAVRLAERRARGQTAHDPGEPRD